jgi:RNA polymerase sigma factor (sigma-70 family)
MLRPKSTEPASANNLLAARKREVLLVGRVASGDIAAFEVLYRCFYPRLRRFLERMTQRPQLVEEILNDTMLVVWRKAGTYNLKSTVSTWIFAIAFRKALKALKRLDDPVDADADDEASPDGLGPEGNLMQQERRALLSEAMSSLSAEQRAVVELTYYQDCGYRDIAEIMQCPVDSVKTRMFYARRKLKALLAGREEDLL